MIDACNFVNVIPIWHDLYDVSVPRSAIKKEQFQEMKNDHLELEPFVTCTDCGRRVHQICVLHMEHIWPLG